MQKNIVLLIVFFFMLTHSSFSQMTDSIKKTDSTKGLVHFGGAVTVTNKGISLIPTFALGKPAVMFDLSMGKRKLSFEPQFRFALDGKPWSFIFWLRYKLVNKNKISVTLGAHPALNFRTEAVSINSISKDVIVTRRYLTGELSPNYLVSKNVSVGLYYLYSRGIDKDATRNTHFLTVNSNFSNIQFANHLFARFTPQFYYLKQDKLDGFYFTSTLTLAKKNFPLAIQSIINKSINTNITGTTRIVWNVSLIYSFNKTYVQTQ
jgi:hypothetical protein